MKTNNVSYNSIYDEDYMPI